MNEQNGVRQMRSDIEQIRKKKNGCMNINDFSDQLNYYTM